MSTRPLHTVSKYTLHYRRLNERPLHIVSQRTFLSIDELKAWLDLPTQHDVDVIKISRE